VDWDPISRLVTDRAPDAAWSEFLAARGIQVIYPGCEQSADNGDNNENN